MVVENESSMSKQQQTPSNTELVMSRRHFLYGVIGAGVLGATLGAPEIECAYAEENVTSLQVSPDEIISQVDDCEKAEPENMVSLVGSFELPFGTLVWANNDSYAACLFPTETSKPITKAGALFLGSGNYSVLLEDAVGAAQGFDIYDVRLSDQGIIWTEANIFSNVWHIYTATFDGNGIGEAIKVDEGDSDWETPTIAAIGSNAYWQVLPHLSGNKLDQVSELRRAAFGRDSKNVVFTSHGRMCSPIYPSSDRLVITPRTETDAIHHRLTCLDGATGETKDTLVLPSSMRPLEAGWGKNGFFFCFDGGYSHGGGIANMGTYTPQDYFGQGDYIKKTWFWWTKSPTAPPCWCGDFFVVKSTTNVCGVDLATKTYFVIATESGSDTYGDYLASTGMNSNFVTYANINSKSIDGTVRKCCLVRVWQPL